MRSRSSLSHSILPSIFTGGQVRTAQEGFSRRDFQVDVRPRRRDNLIEGGMTALPNAMATRNWFLPTVKALERALRQAEFDRPATDSAPFFFFLRRDVWSRSRVT
jgi:hypothetical protein